MTAGRPTFGATIHALTLTHPDHGVLHTPEEADMAEVLRDVEKRHQGADQPDPGTGDVHLRSWGICSTCATPWPCAAWVEAEQDAVLYLGRAQDRVWTQAQVRMAELARREQGRAAANGNRPPLARGIRRTSTGGSPC